MVILKLNELMESKNVGQRELSRQTGIRQATLSCYCNDTYKQISKEHIDILCIFFDCKVADLIEYVKED